MPHTVSISGRVVGSSPTAQGLTLIANIFAACKLGHTIHGGLFS